jgi:nicotinate-nucleotide adenylyltransferase
MTKIGILGGTFDPVHIGHLVLAQCAQQAFALDKVIFIPTGNPARKLATTVATPGQRLEMLRLACASNPNFEVSALEVERQGVTYTIDTVAQLREQYGEQAKLHFIVGADAICDLPTWKDANRLAPQLTFIAAAREGYEVSGCIVTARQQGFDIQMLEMPQMSISSVLIRKMLARKQSVRYLVGDSVIDYIVEHRLYAGL